MIRMQNIHFQYGRKLLFAGTHQPRDPPGPYLRAAWNERSGKKPPCSNCSPGSCFPSIGTTSVLGFDPTKRNPAMLEEVFHCPRGILAPPGMRASEYLKIQAPFYPRFDKAAFDRTASISTWTLPNGSMITPSDKRKTAALLRTSLRTSLLILDEPTNGLDIPSKSQFRRTVASAMTENRTFIISTHQVRDMENLIDPIIILHNGRVVFHNSLEAVSAQYTSRLERTSPKATQWSLRESPRWLECDVRTGFPGGRDPDRSRTLFNASGLKTRRLRQHQRERSSRGCEMKLHIC